MTQTVQFQPDPMTKETTSVFPIIHFTQLDGVYISYVTLEYLWQRHSLLSFKLLSQGIVNNRLGLFRCVCFVDSCLSFCTFSFCHCVVSTSSIYGFWFTQLPLWYLQTLLTKSFFGRYAYLHLVEKCTGILREMVLAIRFWF